MGEEDDVIRVGDYVEVLGNSYTAAPGLVGLVENVDRTSVHARDSSHLRCISLKWVRKVTLASLYADEEAYHAMREEADKMNEVYDEVYPKAEFGSFNTPFKQMLREQREDATAFVPFEEGGLDEPGEDPMDLAIQDACAFGSTYSLGYGLPDVKSAGDILREAADIVDGQRNKTHGARERSFQAIADLWNTYLRHARLLHSEDGLIDVDVAQMMVLLKIARSLTGEPIADHFVDAAGYSGVAGELASRAAA